MTSDVPSSNGSGVYVCNWAWPGLEGTSKLHDEVVQVPMVPTPATLPSPF